MKNLFNSSTRGGGRFLASCFCFESSFKTLVSGQAARLGFTLAEVLVTLGIIGVVSAMTVPTLMQNHQRKTYVTQLHKVYNELNQAFQQFKNDNNALTLLEAGLSDQTAVNNFLKTYFKTVTVCDTLEEPCVYDAKYKNLNGVTLANNWWPDANCGVLGSGASVCIEAFHNDKVNGIKYGHIFIDINGLKGPNIAGRDAYVVMYYEDGTIDEEGVAPSCNTMKECTVASNASTLREEKYTKCKSSSDFKGCFGKILNDNWEMNY